MKKAKNLMILVIALIMIFTFRAQSQEQKSEVPEAIRMAGKWIGKWTGSFTMVSEGKTIKPKAEWVFIKTSLQVLRAVKQLNPRLITKSGLMLGLGEDQAEIIGAMSDLRDAGVDILTLGQYLSPSEKHWPVARYIPPDEFEYLASLGYKMQFKSVLAGPLVRSSYHSDQISKGL